MKYKKILLNALWGTLAVAFWILVWWLVAARIEESLLFPTPFEVFDRLWVLIRAEEFWKISLFSLLRILYGIFLSVLFGVPLAVLTAALSPARILTRPVLTAIRATPVAAFIMLIWLFIGADDVPAIITVLIALPVIWKNVETGILGIDKQLSAMAKSFRVPLWKRILLLYVPSVLPSFQSALQTAIGLGWKAGIAAEILVHTKHSIGNEIYEANLLIETADLFAWTLTVILLSLLIELLFSALLSRLFRRVTPKSERKEDGA